MFYFSSFCLCPLVYVLRSLIEYWCDIWLGLNLFVFKNYKHVLHNNWHTWIKIFSETKLPPHPLNLIQIAQSQNPQIWNDDELMNSRSPNAIVPLASIGDPNPRWRVQRQTPSAIEDNGYWSSTKSLSVIAIDTREDFQIRKGICLHGFAQQFFTRLPCTGSYVVNLYQKQEREAAMLMRKQKTYFILDDEID